MAKLDPTMVFNNLAYLLDLELLREAFRLTRKDGAPGVDKQTAADYERNLEANLQSLWERMRAGTYWAPPVKRKHIPKDDKGNTRPIGIPTFEDKVLQRAAAMVLEAVYEQDFLDCSYGFRPGRSPHQALDALWKGLMDMGGGWVLDVDIKGFFDNLDHAHLRAILDLRVQDRGIRRLIGKWLNAGVWESGEVHHPEAGTPQGGVISPLLSNIYLHEVVDKWFVEMVSPALKGRAFLVRYADDWVAVFSLKEDALRVLQTLPKRLGRFGLAVSEEKTKLVPFQRPARSAESYEGGTFDFLGFTHYWGKSRKGVWVVKRKTAKTRLRRALKRMNEWCRDNRDLKLADQFTALRRKLQGHYAYYGITCNARALKSFLHGVTRLWHKWLSRRSWRATINWDKMSKLLQHYPLPPPRVVRSVYRVAKLMT
jgi:group II intron reverse transcriptase/maturase